MSFLDFFEDCETKTVQFQTQASTKDAGGRSVTAWTNTGDAVSVTWWMDTSRETNANEKFVDKMGGRCGVPYDSGITPSTIMRMYISASEIYFVVGVDNVAGFDDFYVVSWTRDL